MTTRRVQRSVGREEEEKVDCPENEENVSFDEKVVVDWTTLYDSAIIQIFSCLGYRDRANFSSTCHKLHSLGKSSCLWEELDLRFHKCGATAASSLASRCEELQKIWFSGVESVHPITNIQAKDLREIRGDQCQNMSDSTLSMLVGRQKALESLHIKLGFNERVSSDGVQSIAICCQKLQRLWLSGVGRVDADATIALAKNCQNLRDVGFMDCQKVDFTGLVNVSSVRFLSVAGTKNIKWTLVPQLCLCLPELIALDVSRTDITPSTVSRLFSSSLRLKVLCALNCQLLEENPSFATNLNHRSKVLLAPFTDILKGVATLCRHIPRNNENVFIDWRNSNMIVSRVDEILNWLEWIISDSLLCVSASNPPAWDDFWLNQGLKLLLGFMQSPKEEVQETAVMTLATFRKVDGEAACIDTQMADAVVRVGGIRLLLNLAQSWREGLQSVAAKVIANLSFKNNVAKTVANEGGISILVNLLTSMNKLVAEEAARGLWKLSSWQDHMVAFTEAGGSKALVDLIFKWSSSRDSKDVLERAAGTLANLASDEKCSVEIASAGGIGALVSLARSCEDKAVQEQVCRALANLAGHGDRNGNVEAIGQEAGALEALAQFTRSDDENVRQNAAVALWNLSFDERNQEAIAAANGVEALVALVKSSTNASRELQVIVAGALWGLSASEANSIAIGEEGGVEPLVILADSYAEDVQEKAAVALWNLASDPRNAGYIIEFGGVPALEHLCSFSFSKLASFLSALALSNVFSGRVDEYVPRTVDIDGLRRRALKHIEGFIMASSDHWVIASAATLEQVAQCIRIPETQALRCRGNELKTLVTMLPNPDPTLNMWAAFALFQPLGEDS